MTDQELRYDVMVQTALRSVVQQALTLVAEHGLPGDHHFYLAFNPQHPDADIPDFLKDRFGEEMTIVLQHQFWDLNVSDDGFGVTLQFDRKPYPLWVPFDALRGFFDPSVQFGLQFQGEDEDEEIDDELASRLGLVDLDQEMDLSDLSDEELFTILERKKEEAENAQGATAIDTNDDDDDDEPDPGSNGPSTGEVIALDKFRKKP